MARSITDYIKKAPDLHCLTGVTPEQISEAEKTLGTRFSKDYREYLTAFGLASFDDHELTGICDSKHLNVTEATEAARKHTPAAKKEWYLLEDLGIDDILIWQAPDGTIHQTVDGQRARRIANCLYDYLDE